MAASSFVLVPSFFLSLSPHFHTRSDGSIKQFECTPERFQDLRFQAALVLRNMQSLAKHPTLLMNAEQQQ